MKDDLKLVKSQISREEFEENSDTSKLDHQMEMLQEFLEINDIPPQDALTIFSNSLIWICESYFNKEVFDAVVDGIKNGWDKARQ